MIDSDLNCDRIGREKWWNQTWTVTESDEKCDQILISSLPVHTMAFQKIQMLQRKPDISKNIDKYYLETIFGVTFVFNRQFFNYQIYS